MPRPSLPAEITAWGFYSMHQVASWGLILYAQMHGLNLKNWVKWAFLALYVGGTVFVYSGRGVSHLWELSAILLIEYPAVVVLALLIGLIVRVTGWRRPTLKAARN